MEVQCLCCQKKFDKAESEIKKTKGNFCSKSCAAKINNQSKPKRQLTNTCSRCGILIPKSRKKCKDCFEELNVTLKELIDNDSHRASAYSKVRSRARMVAKSLGWNSCCNCSYSKHIEIAHIKAIHQFSDDTLISTINHPNNLRPFCPNCHWEFDNNQLNL